jgi:AcrR family transcriptional regulator
MNDDGDAEELWPPFYLPGQNPRDQRVHAHIREVRDHGRVPSRRARSLSRNEIVRAAIAVADADGPDAVSMRRIARELNAGAMSLYWHVSSKEELLDLMLDAVEGEMARPEPSGDVRADLRAIACDARSALLRHRWVISFIGGRPPMGPKALRSAEQSLALFAGAAPDLATAMNILSSVMTYVMGTVLREQQEERSQQDQRRAQESAGLSEDEMAEVLGSFVLRLRQSGRYPHIVQMIDEGVDPDAPETRDERFEFGLDCLLDGVLARLSAGSPPGRGLRGRARRADT